MAGNGEVSLDEYALGQAAAPPPPDAPPADVTQSEDLQQLPGYQTGQEHTLESYAMGQPAPQGDAGFGGADMEQKYKHPIMKGLDVLSIPHQALARKAVENAQGIKTEVGSILNDLGFDTKDWQPVDEAKWKMMMQSPELYGHDFVNLVYNKTDDNGMKRLLTGIAADFADPALLINELGGIAKGAMALEKEGKLASTAVEQFRNGERILGKIGPVEIKSKTVAPWAMEKANKIIQGTFDTADALTNGRSSRVWHWFSFNPETPELANHIQEFRGAQNADTLQNVRRFEELSPMVDGHTPEQLAQAVSAQELPTKVDLEAQTIKGKPVFRLTTRGEKPFMEQIGRQETTMPFMGKAFSDPDIKATNIFQPSNDAQLSKYINKTFGTDIVDPEFKNMTPETFNMIQESLINAGHDGLDLSKTNFAKGRLGSSEIKFSRESPAVFEPQFQTAIKEGYKFPTQALADLHEIGAQSAMNDLTKLNGAYGWLDKEGNPTRGLGLWSQKQIDELAEKGVMNGPKKYYPRVLDPGLEALDKQTGGKISQMFGKQIDTGIGTFNGGSPYKARKYGELLTVESANDLRLRINDVMKEAGLPAYGGPIWDLDPVRAMTRRSQQVNDAINKKNFLDKVATIGKEDRQIMAMSKAEQAKYVKFRLSADTSELLKELGPDGQKKILGAQIDGKWFKSSDLDRIKDVMNFEPMSAADATLNSMSIATRFFRKGVLFSPTYFMGNFKGNLINNVIAAPNKSRLLNNYMDAFRMINDWKNKEGKVFNVAGKPRVVEDIIGEMARANLWDSGGIREITPLGQDMMNTANAAKVVRRQTGQMGSLWKPFKFNQEFTELYADNHAKLALYLNALESGYSKEAAAKKVADSLFDFGDVSPGFERIRKVVPFVTYPTKMSNFAIKTVAKYPWLPELVDKFGDLYTKSKVTENPMDEDMLKNAMPRYYSYMFDPLISQVLPGGNVMIDTMNSPFGTVEGLMQTLTEGPLKAIPGAEEFFLLNLNRDPNSGQMIDDVKGLEEGFKGSPNIVEALGKQLFTDAIPKPVLFAINQAATKAGQEANNPYIHALTDRIAKFARNPYEAKTATKATKFRAFQDQNDEDLGQYFTTHTFLRKFAPDFFEQVVQKNDPEFYRSIGSAYRQHLKDITFGFQNMTNADKEVFIRNYILDNKMKEKKNAYEAIILNQDAAMDPALGSGDIEKIDKDVENIANQKELLGKTADLIFNLGKKYNTEIKQGPHELPQ